MAAGETKLRIIKEASLGPMGNLQKSFGSSATVLQCYALAFSRHEFSLKFLKGQSLGQSRKWLISKSAKTLVLLCQGFFSIVFFVKVP